MFEHVLVHLNLGCALIVQFPLNNERCIVYHILYTMFPIHCIPHIIYHVPNEWYTTYYIPCSQCIVYHILCTMLPMHGIPHIIYRVPNALYPWLKMSTKLPILDYLVGGMLNLNDWLEN